MPTVIATPGAVNANSYVTVAEADAYHATHLYASKWTSASTAVKETALIMATRLLDSLYEWAEWPTFPEQALRWPRFGLLEANEVEFLDEHTIPQELKNATAEFARQLIASDRTADSAIEAQGILSLTAGPVSLSFKDSAGPKVLPDAVVNLLPRQWGFPRDTAGGTRELVRA